MSTRPAHGLSPKDQAAFRQEVDAIKQYGPNAPRFFNGTSSCGYFKSIESDGMRPRTRAPKEKRR
jgi:hypothetical protein